MRAEILAGFLLFPWSTAYGQATHPAPEVKVIGHAQSPLIGKSVSLVLQDGTGKAGMLASISVDGINLLTGAGGEKVLFTRMTTSDQNKFGYNPSALAAFTTEEKARATQDGIGPHGVAQWEIDVEKQRAAQAQAEAARQALYAHQFILTGDVIQFVRNQQEPGTLVQQTNQGKEICFVEESKVGGHVDDKVSLQVASVGWYDYVNFGGEDVHARKCVVVPDEYKADLTEN